MYERTGTIFSIARENTPVEGCTVSKLVAETEGRRISHFSLDANTDIGAETYSYIKLWYVDDGEFEVQTGFNASTNPLIQHHAKSAKFARFHSVKELGELGVKQKDGFATDLPVLKTGDMFVTPIGTPIGVKSRTGGVYTEIELGKGTAMNSKLEPGKVFALKDLLPYAEGRIVNMDLVNGPKTKFVIMSFAAGTGLSEHSAPGDALIFALDGEGVIGYEGKEYTVKAGENFAFAKDGAHWVKAVKSFKMALLLTLD